MTSHLKRFSVVTGEWEPYEDSKVRYTHLFVSYSVVILLVSIILEKTKIFSNIREDILNN